jgi:hypothetical protein
MKRIYIAGPCTGLPDLNYPAFNAEAARLRALGYQVESPADNPAPPCGTWAGYMRLSIPQLLTCDFVATLPGWVKSRGATIEVGIAYALAMPVIDAAAVEIGPLPVERAA